MNRMTVYKFNFAIGQRSGKKDCIWSGEKSDIVYEFKNGQTWKIWP